MTIFEVLAGAEAGPPRHVHDHEDEAVFVLEGEIDLLVDGTITRLGPGGFAFAPRGIPHTWAVVSEQPVRHLAVVTPAASRTSCAPSAGRPAGRADPAAGAGHAARHGRRHGGRRAGQHPLPRPAASNLVKLVVGQDRGFPSPGTGAIELTHGAPTRGASADVAQLVEHFTRNEGVRGSNPRVGSGISARSASSRRVKCEQPCSSVGWAESSASVTLSGSQADSPSPGLA